MCGRLTLLATWALMNKMTLYALILYIAVLILPEIYTKKTTKSINQQTTERKSDQLNVNNEIPWFRNAFYGFSVSTPYPPDQLHIFGLNDRL
jgi:hypothetical protein